MAKHDPIEDLEALVTAGTATPDDRKLLRILKESKARAGGGRRPNAPTNLRSVASVRTPSSTLRATDKLLTQRETGASARDIDRIVRGQ